MRIEGHPVLGASLGGRPVVLMFDGHPIPAREGEPIAAALMAAGIRKIRSTRLGHSSRGIYCGIGHCFECRVTVNGVPGVRSCLTPVMEGMWVESDG